MRRLCCLALVVAPLATCGGVAVAAGGKLPYGKLTATEYSSLGRMFASVKAGANAKPKNWSAMRAGCSAGQSSTALLVAIRSSCEADVLFLRALFTFASAKAKCGPTMPHKLTCQVSLFNALSRDARAFYTADAAARTAAIERGFSGTCLAVISTRARQLRAEKQLSDATDTLAEDDRAALKAHEGHPIPGFDRTKAENDGQAFRREVVAVFAAPAPSNVRDCPHASARHVAIEA
jgi:hypothetical protein